MLIKKVIRQNSLAYQQGLYFADQNLIHDVDTIFSPLINGLENLEKDLLSLPTDELEWLLAECKSRKIEHTMDEFQQGCFQKLEKIFEKLIYLHKKSYHSAHKLHHEAFRSAIFLRHRAKRLTVALEFPPMTRC